MNPPEPTPELFAQARRAQGAWAQRSLRERLRTITALRQLLASRMDQLCLTVTQDIGRSAAEVLATDLVPVLDGLLFLEKEAKRLLATQRLPGRWRPLWLIGTKVRVQRVPLGVVGIIGTWNYPLLLNLIPMAQALVAGNAIVWKPSEQTPVVAAMLQEIFGQLDLPQGLVTTLPTERQYGQWLIEGDIDHLIFTGSTAVGRQIAQRLGERLIPSTLELSGCDALLVLPDANLPLAAKAAWYGFQLNKGQTCIAVRRLLVPRALYPEMLRLLEEYAKNARPEPVLLPGQVRQAQALVDEAIALGGRILGGFDPEYQTDEPPRLRPTIIADAHPGIKLSQDVYFAPVMGIIPYDDPSDEAIVAMLERCTNQLTLAIYTNDVNRATVLASRVRVGSVIINDVIAPTAHPGWAFGGQLGSGWGLTRGVEGLLTLTRAQYVGERSGDFRPHYSGATANISGMLGAYATWKHHPDRAQGRRSLIRLLRYLWRVWRRGS